MVVHVGLQTQKMAPERTPRNDAAVCISGDIGFQASGEDSVSGEMPQCRAAWTTAALAGRLRAAGLPVTYTAGAEQYAEMATNYAALDAVSDMAEGSRPVVGLVHVPDQEIMSSPTVAEVAARFPLSSSPMWSAAAARLWQVLEDSVCRAATEHCV